MEVNTHGGAWKEGTEARWMNLSDERTTQPLVEAESLRLLMSRSWPTLDRSGLRLSDHSRDVDMEACDRAKGVRGRTFSRAIDPKEIT